MSETVGAARATGVLAVVAAMTGAVYLGPDFWARRPLPDGQLSIVAQVESWGPIWPALFFIVAAGLVWSVHARRHVALAHSLAAGVWTFYASALFFSAAYSEPPGPILASAIAYGTTALHWAMIRVWADQGVR